MSSFWYLIKEGFRNIVANRLMSFASIGTLVACMLLIGSSLLFSMNVNQIIGYVSEQNEIEVELADDIEEDELPDIDKQISLIDNVYDRMYISKDALLKEQQAKSEDLAELLAPFEEIGENPLYNSYRLKIKDPSQLASTVMKLESIPGVTAVRAQTEVAEIVTSIKHAVATGGFFIVAILIVVSLVIIANTIKVTVFNRRKEINIMKYVGATDSFIRLPFFIEGFMLGLMSALIAFGLLWLGYNQVLDIISQNQSTWILQAYQNMIPFPDMALRLFTWFACGGIGIGVFGSMFFVSKYLKV
ncbi:MULTISPECIES: permease-like cell division protein FtsX [Anaerotruncus]|jgi:cell division transport system permease protein|uniref:permease-like cell division protein FtsX n=1 Tax=Anaerotruncus TaxID=244127 RepID=UPI00082BAA05|nr:MULTISPECIES: permease-like cell division protein FtsX [Anaerotruncus]RGX54235.1 ABC transporter permease [Anaerotruncus sp. AF02-27]